MARAVRLDDALTRVLCHLLRHEPESYGVTLDKQGWAEVDAVLGAVTCKLKRLCAWRRPTVEDLRRVAEGKYPRRFQVTGGRMRALYGHSLHEVLVGEERRPPRYLFHGTCSNLLTVIREIGLIPTTRRFVHLTSDFDYAARVAASKYSSPVVLTVLAQGAADMGVVFRQANNHVWLAPSVASAFIEEHTECDECSSYPDSTLRWDCDGRSAERSE